MKLTAKVLFAQLIVLTIALATTAWLINQRVGDAYQGYFYETQAAQLTALAEQAASQYVNLGDWAQVQSWLDQFSPMMAGRNGMMGGMGAGMRSGMGMMDHDSTASYLLVDPQGGTPLGNDGSAVAASMLEAGVPVVVDGVTVAKLVALRPLGQMGRTEEILLAQVHTAILVSAAIAGAIALIIGALLVGGILRPLRAVESAVAAIAAGNLTARVSETGSDEIANLGVAVNHMAQSLEAQELLRQRLVSDVAHELRTPLSVVQGNLQAILDGVYPLNTEEIRTIFDETQLLSRLVADLHELAQAEAGRLPLQRQPLPVAGILSHLADLYTPLALTKGIQLEVDAPPQPLEVSADPDRLQQILHNLVGNALRHTPAGERIRITAAAEGSSDERAVRFTIQDTGGGIAAADLPNVFERFYRGEASRLRPTEQSAGAGLGLAIAKALVHAHGGQIGVHATNPHGATFWFTLPL